MGKVLYPFGKADQPAALSTANAVAAHIAGLNEQGGASIDNQLTIQKMSLAADCTFDLIPGAELRAGAIYELWISCDGTIRTVTPGTGFSAGSPAVAGVANKTVKVRYNYDGSSFSQEAAKLQIN
jgi:hypothetical protein